MKRYNGQMGTLRMQADTGERSVLVSCSPFGSMGKEFSFLSAVSSYTPGLFLSSCCWKMLDWHTVLSASWWLLCLTPCTDSTREDQLPNSGTALRCLLEAPFACLGFPLSVRNALPSSTFIQMMTIPIFGEKCPGFFIAAQM